MCGICGIRRYGEASIERDELDLLLVHNQSRGLEATGVALQQADGSIDVFKDNTTAFEFVKSKEYDTFMQTYLKPDTLTALGHCRKSTGATPKLMKNNHPMFSGITAVIHNGHITNHEAMFKEWKLERKAETDSDIFRALLDREGLTRKAVSMMQSFVGSAAIAAVSPKFPGKLLLGRSGNPIELAATHNFLYWSSERGPLYKVLRPFRVVFGIVMRQMTPDEYCMIGMNDNSAWLLGGPTKSKDPANENFVEWHQELKIATHFTAATYTCHEQFFEKRVRFYDDHPVDVIQCPKCGQYLPVPQALLHDLKKLACKNCKTNLG